ncbi:PaREP1 family protein [Vulcanisaeta sp. JCM 16161]|uniref:PaREP1 family protein n=1 Tax=Vulcanisaeta sp. JCM 16161 TaxID=1295372 RepID=UPI000A941EAA
MQELPKPWFDIDGYRRTRLLETRYETELARRFLDEGLTRNAADKAYQAWKALVAAFAAENRDKLRGLFKGVVRLRGNKVIERVDWVIALMPSNSLKRMSQVIGATLTYTQTWQYYFISTNTMGRINRGILSQYWDDESARADITQVLSVIDRLLREKGI